MVQRKDEVAQQYLAAFTADEGVLHRQGAGENVGLSDREALLASGRKVSGWGGTNARVDTFTGAELGRQEPLAEAPVERRNVDTPVGAGALNTNCFPSGRNTGQIWNWLEFDLNTGFGTPLPNRMRWPKPPT